jgi:hypothetical protein
MNNHDRSQPAPQTSVRALGSEHSIDSAEKPRFSKKHKNMTLDYQRLADGHNSEKGVFQQNQYRYYALAPSPVGGRPSVLAGRNRRARRSCLDGLFEPRVVLPCQGREEVNKCLRVDGRELGV